ncbi:MAG: GNAT family N-acetyltransferase [Anaerolineaceae bacterium]|nr:GNAT family N-acetyltransferase [Anaerolineaceae bacterium]
MKIRPANISDAPAASELILATMGKAGEVLFGLGSRQRAAAAMASFFQRSAGRFSHRYVDVAEVDDRQAGLLLSFPARRLFIETLWLGLEMMREYSVGELARLAWVNVHGDFLAKEAEPDQYYVAHLAVAQLFQRQGVARRLMAAAEERARAAGLGKCALTVDLANTTARRLYESLGYAVVHTHRTPELEARFGTGGFERRVKILTT